MYHAFVRIEGCWRQSHVGRHEVNNVPLRILRHVQIKSGPCIEDGVTMDRKVQGFPEVQVCQGQLVPVSVIGQAVKETAQATVQSNLVVVPFPGRNHFVQFQVAGFQDFAQIVIDGKGRLSCRVEVRSRVRTAVHRRTVVTVHVAENCIINGRTFQGYLPGK